MESIYTRTEMLIGAQGVERLKRSKVAIFGIGGVGAHAADAIARAGVGAIDLIDADKVSLTNINRQLIALHSTVGEYKTAVMRDRIRDINPDCAVRCFDVFFDASTADAFDFSEYDYVVDAIDSVASKVELIVRAKAAGARIVCSMGAGNKLDPTGFQVADISKTEVCPLAKAVRTRLKSLGIKGVKAVFSKEPPVTVGGEERGKRVPASISFVPSVAGLIIAAEVIKDLAL